MLAARQKFKSLIHERRVQELREMMGEAADVNTKRVARARNLVHGLHL
jgi:hypothetical protein